MITAALSNTDYCFTDKNDLATLTRLYASYRIAQNFDEGKF